MAKSNEEVLEALRQLDPKEDDHWTADGSPLMAVVENLLDDRTVTRKQVQSVAPQFSRSNPVLPEAPVPAEVQNKGDVEAAGADPAVASEQVMPSTAPPAPPAPPAGPEVDPQDLEEEEHAGNRDKYDEQLKAMVEDIAQVDREIEKLREIKADLERQHDVLVSERDRKFPPKTQAEAFNEYLQQQQNNRRARAGLSPVDNALRGRPRVQRNTLTNRAV